MRTKRQMGFTLVELMIVIAIIAILADILIPNFVRARSQGQLVSCESNEKNLTTALEMYAVDAGGYYPASMSLLTPNYIKVIPTCPAAGSDTYLASYTAVNILTGSQNTAYTYFCSGLNHAILNIPANFPQYQSAQGLISGQP